LILRILMNADLDEAIAYLAEPASAIPAPTLLRDRDQGVSGNYWAWRLQMAEHIASELDSERFGVDGFYVFGSTKNATAGPASDIDILIHFKGSFLARRLESCTG
jgi:pyruvate,water dikinase